MKSLIVIISFVLTLAVGGCVSPNEQPLASSGDEDFGIGGTGIIANADSGQGLIGRITGYGSIFVNGIEVELDSRTEITVNDVSVADHDFSIGEVVEVLTVDSRKHTSAARINVRHEVIGRIAESSEGHLVIEGERIKLPEASDRQYSAGEWVAVSGFRDHRGQVHASLVQPIERAGASAQVRTTPGKLPAWAGSRSWIVEGFPAVYAQQWPELEALGRDMSGPVHFSVSRQADGVDITRLDASVMPRGSRRPAARRGSGSPARNAPHRTRGSGYRRR